MAYLSRADIESIAESVIRQYKAAYVPERHLCYTVDILELAAMLGIRVEYVYITREGSILGQTSSGGALTRIFDDNMEPKYFYLDGSTILVDKRLLSHPGLTARRNFTIAHELAHQIINRKHPRAEGYQNRVFCDYRRSVKPISDWDEWQADVLAAALLLPPEVVKDSMFMNGLGEKMTVLSRKYSENKYKLLCAMADFLQVSRTALSYRMEQLGLLERNCLVTEAKMRKEMYRHAG